MTVVAGLDTATRDLAVAVVAGAEVIAEARVAPPDGGRPRHATDLMPELERAVVAAGGWASIDELACGVGPGSFTGVRIGVATARALALALGKPVRPAGTLAAVAHGIAAEGAVLALAVLDARRGEAFAALHGAHGEEIWEPFVAAPEALAGRVASLPEAPLAAGDGALRFRRELEAAGATVLPADHPAHRVSAARVCLVAGPAVAPEDLRPVYLRRPDAELWRERQRQHD